MKLRTIDVIILLLLGLLCITRATWGLFKDININLSDAKSVTGQVTYADITKIEAATFKSKKYKTVFALRLENSTQNFAVDRGADFCNYLKTQIKTGDTIKLLYRHSTSDNNTFVFQIEKNQIVIADFSGYKSRETEMIVLLYFFGVAILGGLSIWYVNNKKQTRMTESKY